MSNKKPMPPQKPVPKPPLAYDHFRESYRDRVQSNNVSPRDPILKAPPEPPKKKQ